ncbi:hypothetical protein HPP92_019477 [Vanilla planifolia]|uniref:Uncharacterized protein n=1 Tax=Vanilla planifolia TaxID=51239 RepID=A0A835Q5V1_VANPL|nr:hypothetical protein HPP92_019477 [Vanilla planifolia]
MNKSNSQQSARAFRIRTRPDRCRHPSDLRTKRNRSVRGLPPTIHWLEGALNFTDDIFVFKLSEAGSRSEEGEIEE